MKTSRNSLGADLAFAALLLLLLVSVLIVALNPDFLTQNLISLFVVFAVILITRFTSVTTGLVLNIVIIFLYMTYLIYNTVANNAVYGINSYVWVVMMPLLTGAVAFMSRSAQQVDSEYSELRERVEKYVTIDGQTGLKTKYAYEEELRVFQSLARRHGLNVMLIVWGFRFEDQMQRILSAGEMEKLVIDISEATKEDFRKEDVLYIMQKSPFMWASVTLVRPGYADLIISRMRKNIESIDLRKMLGKRAPKVELRIGYRLDERNDLEPEAMLNGAITQIQYDVWR